MGGCIIHKLSIKSQATKSKDSTLSTSAILFIFKWQLDTLHIQTIYDIRCYKLGECIK